MADNIGGEDGREATWVRSSAIPVSSFQGVQCGKV